MALPVFELLGWAIWEFIFVIIFYNTGAILIRIFTFGKTKFPLFGLPGSRKEKPNFKHGLFCYIYGMAFYTILFIIISLINITS